MTENLIPLQTAYIRQSKDVKNNTWVVFSECDAELGELPNTLSPKQAMSYLHFGRRFELDALNIGIRFGKGLEHTIAEKKLKQSALRIAVLERQNLDLSNALEKHIINQED